MLITTFLDKLNTAPESVEFTDTMAVIEANYLFTETEFSNGQQQNGAGENSGSCKLFAFALQQNLSAAQTLACFGDYYREDVLKNPDGNDHQNIRQFMANGWDAINFSAPALTAK
ncbi:type III effector [Psychromonas marina]|uniref:Type III effector n=1 Tax=Psychromonas marina TaxID=88364 RepID=A0ABQ6DY01_9GAMM|nr:HopJ type III effector protein [Psychromonas marina]GLS89850.1 type III effector [Psychromonas marina]